MWSGVVVLVVVGRLKLYICCKAASEELAGPSPIDGATLDRIRELRVQSRYKCGLHIVESEDEDVKTSEERAMRVVKVSSRRHERALLLLSMQKCFHLCSAVFFFLFCRFCVEWSPKRAHRTSSPSFPMSRCFKWVLGKHFVRELMRNADPISCASFLSEAC